MGGGGGAGSPQKNCMEVRGFHLNKGVALFKICGFLCSIYDLMESKFKI